MRGLRQSTDPVLAGRPRNKWEYVDGGIAVGE